MAFHILVDLVIRRGLLHIEGFNANIGFRFGLSFELYQLGAILVNTRAVKEVGLFYSQVLGIM